MANIRRIKGDEIVKHRHQVDEYRSNYDLLGEKLFILAQSKLTGRETDSIPPITLLTTEVCRALGTRIEHIRRALNKLAFTPIELGNIDDLDSDYDVFVPITCLSYKTKDKTITLVFNDKMVPYLVDVHEKYTVLTAEHCYRLSSKYSIRIYMLIMQWRTKLNLHDEWEVPINYQDFRSYFKFKPEEYKRTYDFKDKVLKPAIADINKSGIGLDVELTGTYKSGREITDYLLTVKKVTPTTPKRVSKPTKKEISDEELISQNQDRFNVLLKLEQAQPDLPGMPNIGPEIRHQINLGGALKRLKAELASEKRRNTI